MDNLHSSRIILMYYKIPSWSIPLCYPCHWSVSSILHCGRGEGGGGGVPGQQTIMVHPSLSYPCHWSVSSILQCGRGEGGGGVFPGQQTIIIHPSLLPMSLVSAKYPALWLVGGGGCSQDKRPSWSIPLSYPCHCSVPSYPALWPRGGGGCSQDKRPSCNNKLHYDHSSQGVGWDYLVDKLEKQNWTLKWRLNSLPKQRPLFMDNCVVIFFYLSRMILLGLFYCLFLVIIYYPKLYLSSEPFIFTTCNVNLIEDQEDFTRLYRFMYIL